MTKAASLALLVALLLPAREPKAASVRQAAITLPAASTVGPITVSPASVSLRANDPDQGSVAGPPVTVFWNVTAGSPSRDWTLSVQAASATLSSCSGVPANALRLSCSSTSVSGGSGSASCSAAFSLTTSPQTVAGGKQGNADRLYTVNLGLTFTDTWRYVAALAPSCSVTLTYTVNAQ